MIRLSRLAGVAIALAAVGGGLLLLNAALLLGVGSLTPFLENGEEPTDFRNLI